jgi:mannosyl-oligosaccharide alpha-1,2-mannosidase
MLRMLRFRRYRIFLAFAAIASLLLLRYLHKDWDQFSLGDTSESLRGQSSTKQDGYVDSTLPLGASNGHPKEAEGPETAQIKASSASKAATQISLPKSSSTSTGLAVIPTQPHVVLPHRTKPGATFKEDEEATEDIHPIGMPGRQDLPTFSAVPTTIHWEKQVEHFPVPTESLILLPTGAPASIPKIQHDFDDETTDAKINREKRQNKVRAEFQKAWKGYKAYAWLHDEISPVSGKFRDPFCGWAATLVDSLDTLWIMGLQEEFEDAARAVDLIDFTTSPRSDIPVFETTIRYLGGLLAAYDVSGGIYKNLLAKAVELADILMGAFDTPNRMPVLFYRWKPTFASQPHRASQRSSTAELGSLAMEFTRLAQLTKDPRYYDAIARITNALYEWQERGTKLDGVFPDSIDASGCNRSVPLSNHQPTTGTAIPITPAKNEEPPKGFVPSAPKTVAEPRPKKKNIKGQGPSELEMQILPGQPSKAQLLERDDNRDEKKPAKRDLGETKMLNSTSTQSQAPIVRDVPVADPKLSNHTTSDIPTDPVTGLPIDMSGAKTAVGSSLGDWDCTPQGLEAATPYGRNKFSMGGGQDSTYEYFSKVFVVSQVSMIY